MLVAPALNAVSINVLADEIAEAVLERLAAEGRAPVALTAAGPYARPARREGGFTLETASGELVRRPPLCMIA